MTLITPIQSHAGDSSRAGRFAGLCGVFSSFGAVRHVAHCTSNR
jgi:hypothetical protein